MPGFEPETLVLETRMLPVTPHSQTQKTKQFLALDTPFPADAEGRNRTYAQPNVTVDLQTIADPFGVFGLQNLPGWQRRNAKERAASASFAEAARSLNILWPLLKAFILRGFSGAEAAAPA